MNVARTGASIVLALTVAACGSTASGSGSIPAPSATATAIASSAAIATSAPSKGPKPSQTDTDWGRIWDSLPSGFPAIPGATPDENAVGGPASAVLVIQGTDAKSAATSLQTQLQNAGYTTIGSLDPLEDGSVVLEVTGKPQGCAIRATATPTGGLTTVTILYGADCPYG
jgi:hypothetical protein